MSAFLFGQCGCCRGALLAEQQEATARVLWPVGRLPFLPNSNNSRSGGISDTRYLGYSFERTTADGKTVWLRQASTLSKFGGAAQDDGSFAHWDLWVDYPHDSFVVLESTDVSYIQLYPSGEVFTYRLYTPYQYTDAVALCQQLLNTIDLLNPNRIYAGIFSQNNADYPFTNLHFCYPSEASSNNWGGLNFNNLNGPSATNVLGADYDQNGQPVYSLNGLGNFAFAANGQWDSSGFIYCTKCAVRTPLTFLSRRDEPLGYVTGAANYLIAPVNLGPGELIFDPTDVPANFADSWWKTASAPPLGTPPPTASETNVTADDTTNTADEQ